MISQTFLHLSSKPGADLDSIIRRRGDLPHFPFSLRPHGLSPRGKVSGALVLALP